MPICMILVPVAQSGWLIWIKKNGKDPGFVQAYHNALLGCGAGRKGSFIIPWRLAKNKGKEYLAQLYFSSLNSIAWKQPACVQT